MPANQSLYATCAAGLQHLLARELTDLGARSVSTAGAGVRFEAELPMAYTACLWSRLANRVLLPIHSGAADSPEALYTLVREVDWSKHMSLKGTLAVDFFTANSNITHSQYGALKVKDAVVDQFREATGERPNVERETPDLRINVYLFRNKARIAIDLSGSSLHRRGYREQAGPAPIKENLAAALLLQCNWPERAERSEPFIDPLCGSGTLVIEAAMMACHIAPGLKRTHYGFTGWLGHDESAWHGVLSDAQARVRRAPCDIGGADKDTKAIAIAIENAELAGVADAVNFTSGNVLTQGLSVPVAQGLVLSNPPYGQRLDIDADFYRQLGSALSASYAGWHCGLFTDIDAPIRQTRLPLKSSLPARNGAIECALYEGRIPDASTGGLHLQSDTPVASSEGAQQPSNVWAQASLNRTTNSAEGDGAEDTEASMLSETNSTQGTAWPAGADATPFVNRLKKNLKRLKSWQKRESINAYRVYDADLPEFAVAIDIYDCDQRHVVVQEYQAPATVNVAMAAARLRAVLDAVPATLNVDVSCMHVKVREKQSGLAQYEKQASSKVTGLVEEFGYRLECNFSDYLDTGVFLDHRKVREFIHKNADAKRFLNLFSYTGSATIAAATGGANSSVSVDLSNRYSQWLTRNLAHNRLDDKQHQVVKSDVNLWLKENQRERFDLILLDPPTFSNSTGIDADWNVQRDHTACIHACMSMLEPDGVLVFSNNYRRFKLDAALGNVRGAGQAKHQARREGSTEQRSKNSVHNKQSDKRANSGPAVNAVQYDIEDKTHWSLDQDFQRNSRIHQCWFIRHSK